MRTKWIPGLASVLAFCLAGCGEGASGPPVNPFAGNWSGTFTNTRDPNPEQGTASLTVNDVGIASGSMVFPNQPRPAPVIGTIYPNGQTALEVSMPEANGVTNVAFRMTGTLTNPTPTTIRGTLSVQAFKSSQYQQTFLLTKQ